MYKVSENIPYTSDKLKCHGKKKIQHPLSVNVLQ